MDFKTENIRKGPVSSAIGVVLILISFYLMVFTDTSTGESLMVLGAGTVFLGLRSDKIDGPGAGKTVTIIIGIGMVLFYCSSCATFDRCARKYGTGETHIVYDTIKVQLKVPVPGDSLLTRLQLDSLLAAQPGDTVMIVSNEGRAQVKFWKDRFNDYLNAQVNCNQDTVYLEKEVPVEVPCPDTVILDTDMEELSRWEKFWEGFKDAAAYIVLAAIGLVVLRLIIK